MSSDSDEPSVPASLNRLAVVVLVVAGLVAMLAFFSFPTLRSMGLSVIQTVLLIAAVEFGSALVAGVAALRLYTTHEADPDG
jgi:hypothetical protein